jgi:uncharacterized protein with beta-barrel porin domain
LLGVGLIPESAAAQCYGGSVVSGNNQTAAPGTPLPAPLVVDATTTDLVGSDVPCVGELLVWTVTSGDATLGVPTTFTDSAGRSSNTLTLGSTPGAVVVTVTGDTGSVVAVFAEGAAVTGTAQATVLAGLRTFTALSSLALISATQQTTNIGLRLASLRRGGPPVALTVGPLSLTAGDSGPPSGPVDSLAPSALAALADVVGRRLGLFVTGHGDFGAQDARRDEAGFDFHTAGFTLGGDYRITDQLIAGVALGYLSAAARLDRGAADLAARGISVSAFATYFVGTAFHVDGIATWGRDWYDTERRDPSGATSSVARADPDGRRLTLSLNAGSDLSFSGLTVGPFVRVDYARIDVDGFRERGGPAFALRVDEQDATSLTTALGTQVSRAVSTAWAVLLPTARAEWQHEFEDGARTVSGALVADPTTAAGLSTRSPDRDYFRLGAGLSATFRRGTAAFLYYEATVGRRDFTSHGLAAGIRLEF